MTNKNHFHLLWVRLSWFHSRSSSITSYTKMCSGLNFLNWIHLMRCTCTFAQGKSSGWIFTVLFHVEYLENSPWKWMKYWFTKDEKWTKWRKTNRLKNWIMVTIIYGKYTQQISHLFCSNKCILLYTSFISSMAILFH